MTLGTEILQYTGNKDLGLGSNADIPAIYTDDNFVNQTNRDLMMINHENNVRKNEQKIKDRDRELQALQSGKVKTGEVLEADRKVIDDLKSKANDAYFKMVDITDKGSPQYQKAALAYKNALTEADDAATWAEHRYVGRKKLESEMSGQQLTSDQEAYKNHLANEDKKGFFSGDYAPYQKSLDLDAESITERGWKDIFGTPQTATTDKKQTKTVNGKTTVTDTETTAPIKGGKGGAPVIHGQDVTTEKITKPDGSVVQVTKSKVDFEKIRQNQLEDYTEGRKNFENQKLFRDQIETLPDETYLPYMQHILKRADDYNTDRGLKAGDEGYIDTKQLAGKLGIDPVTGKRSGQRIMLSTPDFAAYSALAAYNGSYAPREEKFLKDESEFGLKKGLNDANIFYKRALGNAALKKAGAYANHLAAKIKALKPEEQDKFMDDLYKRNLTTQQKLVVPFGQKGVAQAQISAQQALPVFTFDGKNPKQLKPIGSTDITDNAGHITGYKGGHYNQEYRFNGKPVKVSQLNDMYLDYKDKNSKEVREKVGVNSFDDFLKQAIENDFFDVKLIGENGSTDKELSRAAQRSISNSVTKKDQQGVFDETEPTDQPAQPE